MKSGKKKKLVACAAVLMLALYFAAGTGTLYGTSHSGGASAKESTLMAPDERTSAVMLAGKEMQDQYERKIIQTASIVLEVDNVENAFYSIKAIAFEFNGFIADSSMSEQYGRNSGYVVIRVPREDFNAALERAKMFGTVKSEHVTGDDITEEYTDLSARLESLKATEERLLELLETAENVSEIMEIERELAGIRERIEALEGRLKYLDGTVEMSSLTVQIREPEGITSEFNWVEVLGDATDGFIQSTKGVIVLTGTVLPFAALGAAAWVVYKKTRKRRKHAR